MTKTSSRKNINFRKIFDTKTRTQKLEKMFSHYTCCILKDFAGSRNSMKNEHANVTTNLFKLTPWAPFGEIVEIGSGFWKTLISVLYNIFDRSKNRQTMKKTERSTNPVKDLFMPKSAMFSTCLM